MSTQHNVAMAEAGVLASATKECLEVKYGPPMKSRY